jgi:hypothetical protein
MNDFLCGLTGQIVTPFDPIYNKARQEYNRAIQLYPLVIVYCRNKRDVSNAVIWSQKHGAPIRIRSGGHNYEGYSNGDFTLVIDISRMNNMDLDECSNQLYVESGVTNRQIYNFVSEKGYPFPGGTCPTVGVSGYTLGGGWGLSSRNLGLGCDSLVAVEMINYEGAVIRADRECNSDLFWALQGAGGGNFGVIVSMTFNLPPKAEIVTLIEIDYLHVSSKEQEEFLSTWQEWLKTADCRVTLLSRIYNSVNDGLAMLVRGIFYGEPEEARKIMSDFLKLYGAVSNIEAMTFLEAVTIIGSVYPPYEKFQSVSRFVLKDFTNDQISQTVGLIKERAEGSVFAGLSMYAMGGRAAEVGTDDTAFFYRKAEYIIWLDTVWEERRFAEDNREWISKRFPCLEAMTTGSYVNFPYAKLPGYLEEYYGSHVYRLMKIKSKYDPFNTFTFPQGIKKSKEIGFTVPDFEELPTDENEDTQIQPGDAKYREFRYVTQKN